MIQKTFFLSVKAEDTVTRTIRANIFDDMIIAATNPWGTKAAQK